jgi:heme-degrading monooxygenase HmoA
MHSRVTLLEIDTVRMSVESAFARFREEVVPQLADQEGYEGLLVMANPDGRGMIVTLWATEEAARAGVEAGGFYAEAIGRFLTVFRSPPGRDHYEVLVADVPALAPEP